MNPVGFGGGWWLVGRAAFFVCFDLCILCCGCWWQAVEQLLGLGFGGLDCIKCFGLCPLGFGLFFVWIGFLPTLAI